MNRYLSALAAICLAASAAAQQPAGESNPATSGNDPQANQADNPADAGNTGASSGRLPADETGRLLNIGRFNHLDEDKDGVLSEAELDVDAALAAHFEDMDSDRNREIDDVEFMGYRPAGEASADDN